MTTMAGPVARLIKRLGRFPGVGEKTAARLALYLLRCPKEEAIELARAILEVRERIRLCSICFNLTDENPCPLCKDDKRDATQLCVVEEPGDLMALENSGEFKGRYHVLHGVISPLDGVTPDDLHIQELVDRLKEGHIQEVIIATNPTTNGNATALYLSKLIAPFGVKVTRIAQGIPMGGDIKYTDGVTLRKALEGRRDI